MRDSWEDSWRPNVGEARVYRTNWTTRLVMLLFVGLSASSTIGIVHQSVGEHRAPSLGMVLIWGLFAGGSFLLIAHMLISKVVLSADSIAVWTLAGKKELPLSAIRGRSEYTVDDGDGGKVHFLKIEPEDARLPTLKIQKIYSFDDEFYRWFRSLPESGKL